MFPKMADQIPRIKSKRQILQLKPLRLCRKTLIVSLFMLALRICSAQTVTCPTSVPSSAATTTEQSTFDLHFGDLKSEFIFSSILSSFTGYTTNTYGVAVGPVSNSLYYLYYLQSEMNRCDKILHNAYSLCLNELKRESNQPQILVYCAKLNKWHSYHLNYKACIEAKYMDSRVLIVKLKISIF